MREDRRFIFIVLFILTASFAFCGSIFSQENEDSSAKSKDALDDVKFADTMAESFKKAIEEMDMKKSMEKSEERKKLNQELDSYVKEWLDAQNSKQQGQINSLVDQSWELLVTMPPQHFDYYLRDFLYTVKDEDIVEQNSITYPYKATVVVKESLYVERTPLIAEPRSDYQYTSDTDITILLQYNKDSSAWDIMDEKSKINRITNGWPDSIRRKVGMYFIPAK